MEFSLLEAINGECPYLQGKEWVSHLFLAPQLDLDSYESLLNQGFRRSGIVFYKNNCDNCSECIPLRIDVEQFKPSKSQKRAHKKNQDLTIIKEPARFDEESFALYSKFSKTRYQSKGSEEEFQNFLVNTALDTIMMKYYEGDKLIGVGWLDVLVDSISSVYFAFDPDYKDRSLGTFSALQEIELCRELGLNYLHLGFWVEDCQAMSYKNRFQPYQLLINGQWESSEL